MLSNRPLVPVQVRGERRLARSCPSEDGYPRVPNGYVLDCLVATGVWRVIDASYVGSDEAESPSAFRGLAVVADDVIQNFKRAVALDIGPR